MRRFLLLCLGAAAHPSTFHDADIQRLGPKITTEIDPSRAREEIAALRAAGDVPPSRNVVVHISLPADRITLPSEKKQANFHLITSQIAESRLERLMGEELSAKYQEQLLGGGTQERREPYGASYPPPKVVTFKSGAEADNWQKLYGDPTAAEYCNTYGRIVAKRFVNLASHEEVYVFAYSAVEDSSTKTKQYTYNLPEGTEVIPVRSKHLFKTIFCRFRIKNKDIT
ncbi:MAG: uncharacterized protein KVP18_002351 [Porospora cf. gigantea A]|uniref:uncharacterized protein n=1 Tax=Porospora cf. gigantea A TaxID=2853593 RepID=UPI00355983F8|nr:MAG: hypothetical protein KVP18_002351 [Porospora cf. gigantea A]